MHVRVKESIAHSVPQKRLDHDAGQPPEIKARGLERRRIRQRDAVNPACGQHFLCSAVPVDVRDRKLLIPGNVIRKFGGRRGFQTEVHFHLDAARQRFHDIDKTQTPALGGITFGKPRGKKHVVEITAEAALNTGAQNFHRDFTLAPVIAHGCAMNLGDRGGCNRRAKLDEEFVEFPAEGGFHRCNCHGLLKGRHAVLQFFKLSRGVGANNIGPGREELAKLDVGGAEPHHGAGKAGLTTQIFPCNQPRKR